MPKIPDLTGVKLVGEDMPPSKEDQFTPECKLPSLQACDVLLALRDKRISLAMQEWQRAQRSKENPEADGPGASSST